MRVPRAVTLRHEFVEHAPEVLQEGVLYVSIKYATALHRCCCGCGSEVVTPITPTDWKLIFDGKNVSLFPSIGNWEQPCRSHYWIRENRVEWSKAMSQRQIERGREVDRARKEAYYEARAEGGNAGATRGAVEDVVREALGTAKTAKPPE